VLEVREVRVPRPDVAAHLGLPDGERLGFVLVAEVTNTAPLSLAWELDPARSGISKPLNVETRPNVHADHATLGPAFGLLAVGLEPHSPEWSKLIAQAPVVSTPCRNARGFLEGGAVCDRTRDAVIVGWAVHTPSTVVWLEDDAGRTYSLDGAFRRFRQDVHDVVGHEFGHASRDAGLVVRMPGLKAGSKVLLKTISEAGVHVLSETRCSNLSVDPVAAARWLFAVGTPLADLHRRVPAIDEPVLGPLIQYRQDIWDELPVQIRQLGKPSESPTVSVIVPLYGRTDFVEHQLIEFCADPWFVRHAELIYVVDDPKLVEPFGTQAEALHRLYRLPFRWIWGSVNRGFSGANNLGVSQARGEYLVFLNSDAFPQQPGWLEALVGALIERPDIGAVGPRLVFADGSIQHSGMEFIRRDELGVWVNHHPRMGLDPSLDPQRELTVLPSITGACLAMRRADFDRVGGWDTGYLIGDFEDSDLCLKLRDAGLHVAYMPNVQLTHLERQSFKLLGQDEFRTRVVIYNAVRHQTRWAKLIEASTLAAA
jgi:GT2 family glycosyltransferase